MATSSAKAEGREARMFEFYARRLWPVHRLFVWHKIARRCRRCAVSEKYSPRDKHGICQLCAAPVKEHAPKPDLERMSGELDTILKQTKGAGRYDALVLFSGGKDSTLLIHLLKTKYPQLRLLAFTFDNSFLSQTAQNNIESIIRKMDVDHVVVRPRAGFCEQVFGYALAHVGNHGCAATVDPVDGALIFDAARHYAAQARIPLVLIGLSPDQLEQYEGWHNVEADPAFEHSKRTHATRFRIEDLAPDDTSFWWDASRYAKEDIARVLYPFVAWRFDEEYIKKTVVDLGFMESKKMSPLVTNMQLIPLENVVDMFHLGYSSWEPEFTKMIREGRANKRFWRNTFELIEYASKTGLFISSSIDQALARLRLSRKDLGID